MHTCTSLEARGRLMKNDSHSFLWVPGIKRRVISVGPQTWQQAPLPAEPSHCSDYTVFFPTRLWFVSLFLASAFPLCFCSSLQRSTGHTAFYSESYCFVVKPWLSGFRTLWLGTMVISVCRLSPCLVIGNGVCIQIFLKANACHVFNSAIKSMIKARSDLGLYHVL